MQHQNLRRKYIVTVWDDKGTVVRTWRKSLLHNAIAARDAAFDAGYHATLDVMKG